MPTLLEKLNLEELSLVDEPANADAKVTIFKRNSSVEEITKYYCGPSDSESFDFSEIKAKSEISRRKWEAQEELWPIIDAFQTSLRNIASSNLSSQEKLNKIETNISAFLSSIREKMPEVEEELMKFFRQKAESLGVTETDNQLEKSNMSEENKVSVEELQKSLADVTKQNEELAAKLAEAESLSKMSDAEKAYMEKMSDKEKEDWKAMSPEERKRRMGEMKKNDETVEIDGQSISKSAVGEAQFAIFKAQAKKIEALEKSAREAVEKAELVGFAKTAREEYGNLPGSDEEKAYLLKAAASLDENVQNTLNSILKAANKANAGAFETIGKKSSETSNEEEVLEKKAEEIAKRDNISKEQAIRKALEENPELYKG